MSTSGGSWTRSTGVVHEPGPRAEVHEPGPQGVVHEQCPRAGVHGRAPQGWSMDRDDMGHVL